MATKQQRKTAARKARQEAAMADVARVHGRPLARLPSGAAIPLPFKWLNREQKQAVMEVYNRRKRDGLTT